MNAKCGNYDSVCNGVEKKHRATQGISQEALAEKADNYAASQPDVVTLLTHEFKLFGCPDITFGSFNN